MSERPKVRSRYVRKSERLAQLKKNLEIARRSYVTVGVHDDAGEYEAEPGHDPVPVAKVAFWLENGTQYMPARPFFAPALAANQEKLKAMFQRGMDRMTHLNFKVETALGQIGFAAQSWIQNTIKSNVGPALSEPYATERKKKFANQGTRTLIASGLLLRSVRYKLIYNGGEPILGKAGTGTGTGSATRNEKGHFVKRDPASRAGERASARADAGAFKERQRTQRQAARANPEAARKAFDAQRRAYGPSKPKASP